MDHPGQPLRCLAAPVIDDGGAGQVVPLIPAFTMSVWSRRVPIVLTWLWDRRFSRLAACPDGAFRRTVLELAPRSGSVLRVVCRNGRRPGAAAYVGRERSWIVVNKSLLLEDDDVQRFVAAHETGHVTGGHDSLPRTVTVASFLALPVSLLAGPLLLDQVQGSLVLWMTGLMLWVIATYGVFIVGLRSHVVRIHELERQADDFALRAGQPVTAPIAAWFRRHEPAVTRLSILRPFRCHPMPEERLRRGLSS